MCGIFAYQGNKSNTAQLILEGLRSLEYRGYDSWGVAAKQSDGAVYIKKKVGKIGDAQVPNIFSLTGIGHTRWATHGGVTETNAHPHTDCTEKIIVVHNGIIENFQELKSSLLKKGHTFKSETDTEVLAHLVEDEYKPDKKLKDIVDSVYKKLKGMNAFIVFYAPTEEIVAVKDGSPIVFTQTENEVVLASDLTALIPYSNNVYFMEDGEMLSIHNKKATLFSTARNKKRIRYTELSVTAKDLGLGTHKHFMMKEIYEQPAVLENMINSQKEIIKEMATAIANAYGTYLVGCGTAYYACLAGTYLFSKIAKRHINASIGSEFTYLEDFLKKTSLVIALSQSGETIDIISSIKNAKMKKAKIMAITNVLGSSLYRLADYKALLQAGPEKCVLATKSFTAKIAMLYLLAHQLDDSYNFGADQIKNTVQEITTLLKNKDKIKLITQKLLNKEHIFILGRGVSYATAVESALKIKEVSYIHAEGFAAGELKHGVIALIEPGTPVIIFNPEDETYDDTLSAAYEVKARGAYIIGISSKKNDIYDDFIQVNNCKDATIIPNVVVAQLIGYYLAIAKGYDPDKPRNLAKSVVVK